jgi:tetratricopeptide (TPR) repeat protein
MTARAASRKAWCLEPGEESAPGRDLFRTKGEWMDEERPEEQLDDLAARLTMVLLRYAKSMDQGPLARAIHITRSQASDYERGDRAVPRRVLESAAEATGFPTALLDALQRAIRAFLLAARGRSRAERAVTDGLALELLALVREGADLVLAPARPAPSPVSTRPRAEDRIAAEPLRACLRERCTPAQAALLVEEVEEYRSWPVCEQAVLLSVAKAPNHPQEALEWARLAVRIAGLVPGEEAWRSRLDGWARYFQANAERACNDLPAAEGSLARAQRLWEDGKVGDPEWLLNEAWPSWIEANVLRNQRKFDEALLKIDEALALDGGELRSQILLSKSVLFKCLGDPEASTAVLLEAEPLIDPEREPRLAFGVRFNLLGDLCDLGRAAEAAPRLGAVRELAEQLGEALDLTRCTWLHAKVEAGLGHPAEALAAFSQVRSDFRERKLAYNYALVSLDLSLVLLDLGRSAEVAVIADEMLWIFKSQGVHREALAALRLFCEAAQRETATVELARKVGHFLRRAQLNPDLAFVEDGNGRR